MQQTLGNKNQFVEQAIKQHRNVQMTRLAQYLNQTEKKTAERMSRPTGHSRDIQYNWQLHLCLTDSLDWTSFIDIFSLRPAWAGSLSKE